MDMTEAKRQFVKRLKAVVVHLQNAVEDASERDGNDLGAGRDHAAIAYGVLGTALDEAAVALRQEANAEAAVEQ